MSGEERFLSASMRKLKIMHKPKHVKIFRDNNLALKLNPFARKQGKCEKTTQIFGPVCSCKKIHVLKNKPSFKRANNKKVLRESAFILIKCSKQCERDCLKSSGLVKPKLFGENVGQQQDFKSLIAGCEQLTLTAGQAENATDFTTKNFRESRRAGANVVDKSVNNSSCSQQAMAGLSINPPCDVTIDELASYFETFVHIPKKMSSMAEMMYI